jgi:hypothetical protein
MQDLRLPGRMRRVMRTEVMDSRNVLKAVKEEVESFYRHRDDTVVLRWGPSAIQLLRSGRSIGIEIIRHNSQEPALDIRVWRVIRSFDWEWITNRVLVLMVAATAFLLWRASVHDPRAELYQELWIGVFLLIMGPLAWMERRENKEIDKVFPQEERERLRNRLRFRLGQLMESAS